MMYAIGMSKDKRAVIDSATQCTTDYFGWRNAFDDMGEIVSSLLKNTVLILCPVIL